jgi:hypothetical protein
MEIAGGLYSGVSNAKIDIPGDLHNRKRTQSDYSGHLVVCGGVGANR